MKNGLKVFALLLSGVLLLTGGVCVAYYNTRVYGFDTQAKLVSVSDEKITFMDFDIYYSDVKEEIYALADSLPDRAYTVNAVAGAQ